MSEPSPHAARGRLVPLFNAASPVVADLLTKGWAVARACSGETARELVDDLHGDLAALGTGFDPSDRRTWTGGLPQMTHGLCQNQGTGLWRSICKARGFTKRVWEEEIFQDACISSWDAFCYGKPSYQGWVAQHGGDPAVPEMSPWLHTDQSTAKLNMYEHVQGALALTDLGPAELRTQLVAPKEGETPQAFRDRFLAAFPPEAASKKRSLDAEREEWISHTVEEKRWLLANGTPVSPTLQAGEMLLWASGMPHASLAFPLPPGQREHNTRISVFVSALPRSLLRPGELEFRRKLLEKGCTSGHRVCEPGKRPGTFRQCLFARTGRVYKTDGIAPTYVLDHVLRDFARADASVDPVHAITAQFCGGYP